MANISKVEGVSRILAKLKSLENRFGGKSGASVITGYTKSYALIVHERKTTRSGQPKYLEQPARELSEEFGKITTNAIKSGATAEQALKLAALRLQRESQKLVPVKTGDLKGSAFTRVE